MRLFAADEWKNNFGLIAVLFVLLITVPGCVSKKSISGNAPVLAVEKNAPVQEQTPPALEPVVESPEPAPVAVQDKQALPVHRKLLLSANRDSLPENQPEAGFILNVPSKVWAGEPFVIEAGAQGLESVTARWRAKKVSAATGVNGQAPGKAQIMLSTLYKETEKKLPLTLELKWSDGKTETMVADVPVGKRDYPTQRLKVQQKYVTPDASVQEKIKQDRLEVREAINKISPVKYWEAPMLRPVPGVVTSLFGLRRFFNGEERNPHKGVDFNAKTGDPILAADNGKVVVVNEHYYGGNTVIIDHGLGVFTMYLHLSAFNCQVGDIVGRGDVIGYIGSTGRVTGPHLHLSLAVQGELVDAATIIKGMGM